MEDMKASSALFIVLFVFCRFWAVPAYGQIVVGSDVRTIEGGVAVRETAGISGNFIGTQGNQSLGRALATATLLDVTYWRVDFDFSPDGWVLASKLELAPPTSITLTSVEPSDLAAGKEKVTLTLRGTNFDPLNPIRINPPSSFGYYVDPADITVNSPTSLTIMIPPGLTPGSGSIFILASIGEGQSRARPYTVTAPPPVIGALTPNLAHSGATFTLRVTGTDLMTTSLIFFDGGLLTTMPVYNETEDIIALEATVTSFYSAIPGDKTVNIFTDGPGGGLSEPLNFTIDNPPDTIPPAVTITSPSSGAGLDTKEVKMTGRATDDRILSSVSVRVNGGAWRPAQGVSNWTAYLPLITGSNLIEARSTDSAANVSSIAAVTVTTSGSFSDGQVTSAAMVNGGFKFTFKSFSGTTYRIDYTAGDMDTQWTPLTNSLLSTGTATSFEHTSALLEAPRAYYRAVREGAQ